MNDTPETDAFFWRTDIDWNKEVEFCCKMERERNEWKEVAEGSLLGAIKERDEAVRACHIWQQRHSAIVADRDELLKHARRLESERDELQSDLEFRRGLFQLQEQQLNDVRKERDDWKAKFIQQNKDLGCEMMDPNGTIWDYAKKLQTQLPTITKQRDKLADALLELRNNNSLSLGGAAYEIVEQALQSLNQTKP